jgi:hypothetical protein
VSSAATSLCVASQRVFIIERIVLLDFIHRLVSQKIEELKIYIQNITIHTSTKFTQGSITNHRATYLGAYTHKPLKQVRHRWQQMTQPLHTSQLIKTWETQELHTNQGTRTPTHTLNTRSQGKTQVAIVTQLLTDHNTQGGPKYQYKYTQTQSLIEITTQVRILQKLFIKRCVWYLRIL